MLPLGLSAGMSGADAAIEEIYGWRATELIISNEKMEDIIMKIVKSLEQPGLLMKGISELIKNEAKERKRVFFPMMLGSASTGRGVIRAGEATNFSCRTIL